MEHMTDAAKEMLKTAREQGNTVQVEQLMSGQAMLPSVEDQLALVNEWERTARRKFSDAEHEQSESGRRFIEHGAMCYFNCAQALRRVLGESALSCPLGIEILAALRTHGDRPIGSVGVELQNHLPTSIEARLTQVMHRLVCAWYDDGLSCATDFQAIRELAGTDLEQRVSTALVHSLLHFSQFVTHVGILAVHLEQGRIVGEERILSLEQFAVHLGKLASHLIPVAQLDSSGADVFSKTQRSDGCANQ